MGEVGEYWRDVKAHFRQKKARYERRISGDYEWLKNHKDTYMVGDHWRNGDWDFWYTGTVYNPRTKEYSSFKELKKSLDAKTQ